MMADFSRLFEEFGSMKEEDPASEKVQKQVKKVQDFITEHMYTCTNDILYSLWGAYVGGGKLNENIEKMGGEGTAEFIYRAIRIYCGK